MLVPGENEWIPALDLADEAATPISLPTAQAGTVPQAVDPLTPEPTAPGDGPTPGNLFWLALIAGIGVLALYLRWRQQLTVEPQPEILAAARMMPTVSHILARRFGPPRARGPAPKNPAWPSPSHPLRRKESNCHA